VQATLGHLSLEVTERYSGAREGVALRTGAALDDALQYTDAAAAAEGELAHSRTGRTPSWRIKGTASRSTRRNLPLKQENPRLPLGLHLWLRPASIR